MQISDTHQQIQPDFPSLGLAEFLFIFEHEVVDIQATGEILGDDVVVGFGFEEIYYFYDLVYLAGFLEGENLRLVFLEWFLGGLYFEFIHLFEGKIGVALFIFGAVDWTPGSCAEQIAGGVDVVADDFQFLVVHLQEFDVL